MRVAFYTYDLCVGREYLMPWRTILEVAKVMKQSNHEPVLLNACYDENIRNDYEWQGVKVKALKTGFEVLCYELTKLQVDVVYVPFTWRDGLKNLSIFNSLNCQKIAYMTGGVYDIKGAWELLKAGGKTLAKPYIIESLMPKRIFGKALKAAGFSQVIGLTEMTARHAQMAGFEKSVAIYAGNDSFSDIVPDDRLLDEYSLKDKKWMLFSGAPAPTRGAVMLLQAVDKAKDNSIRLVMLMRTDVGSIYEKFEQTLASLKHPDRVLIIKEKVTREQLRAFFGDAYYALLPFIVIPSEVPLTYFELLSCGTPIITFKNSGTTEYLKDSLFIADKTVNGLAKALDKVWSDDNLRKQLSENGKIKMSAHANWKQVGLQWIDTLIK